MKKTIITITLLAIIAVLSVFLAFSYIQFGRSEKRDPYIDNCIQPKYAYAFPLSINSEKKKPEDKIYPMHPWVEITSIPESSKVEIPEIASENSEIWFVSNWWFQMYEWSKPDYAEIQIYNIESNSWKEVDPIIVGTDALVYGIFDSTNGDIFADGYSKDAHYVAQFSFDENQFIKLENSPKLPNGYVIFDNDRQLFWIFVNHVGIMSYDPYTNEMSNRALLPGLYVSDERSNSDVYLASDGSIYLLHGYELPRGRITKFNPETNEIESIFIPSEFPEGYSALFVTNSGEIWINDIGWKAKNGSWYQTIRSTSFIVDKTVETQEIYTWPYAILEYESSNGYLWFSSANGMAWLDNDKQEWCLFTNYYSKVIEDPYQSVWMIVNDKLFELHLSNMD
jgi:hypothetical protein